jgi:hypothetical protein
MPIHNITHNMMFFIRGTTIIAGTRSIGAQTKSEGSCASTLEVDGRRSSMCNNDAELIHTTREVQWVMRSMKSLGKSY